MTSHRTAPAQTAARSKLQAEISRLRSRLDDAEETLNAIKSGRVDALVIDHPFDDRQVVVLGGPDSEARDTVRAIERGQIDAVVVHEGEDDPNVLLLGNAGRRYRLLMEQSSDGVVTLSANGDIVYANAALAAMLGTTPGALIGARFEGSVEPRDRALLAALLDGNRGVHTQAEITLRARGGALAVLATPVATPNEPGTSLLIADLRERRRLQEAEQTLQAIADGKVDAFVVARTAGEEVQMLSDAHRPYRLMVERMQQGAVTLSRAGDILYANQPFAAMLGRALGALVGERLESLVAATDRPLLAALVEAPERAAAKVELGMIHANGTVIPVLVAVAMLPEEGSVCLIVSDLTTQKAYEALVAAEALERSILDQALDSIVLLDADGRVARASRAAFELCRHNPLLEPFHEAFHLDSPSGPPDLVPVLRGTAVLRGAEYTLQCPGAADATVLFGAGPLVDTDGQTRGCVVTMSDITERRRAEDRLRESDRHKDEFLAILAHELRNPLAPIRSAVEILRSTEAVRNPHSSYAVDIIDRQLASLIHLVDDLLDLHRIGQGKIKLQTGILDMRDVVTQALELGKPLLMAKEHELTVALPSEPLWVTGDRVRLSQVVGNLLSNAAKYTPSRGRIQLALERTATHAQVVVVDNGIGIAPDMLPRIFEPYRQAHTHDRSSGGLGLGLTVCRKLIEMHGGSVEARSDGLGRGAKFVAMLPLAVGAEAPAEEAAGAPPARGEPMHVLVVDDNVDAAEALARLLEICGHEVRTVADGPAALEYVARERRPDVVLLDIGLPGIDGYEVARRLRAMPNAAGTRLIAMTGYGSADAREQSQACGIEHHLIKPVDFSVLQAVLAGNR